MRESYRSAVFFCVGVLFWGGGRLAYADDRSEAEANVKKGNEFLRSGDYEKAVSRFEIALKLAPELSSPYAGIGFAYQGLNNCEKATEAFQTYLQKSPEGKLVNDVKNGINECKAKLFCRVEITSNPVGAEVRFNDNVVGTTPYRAEELKAGEYKVSLRVEGYEPYNFPLKAAAGEKYVFPEVALKKIEVAGPATEKIIDKPTEPKPKDTWVGVNYNGLLTHAKARGQAAAFVGSGVDLLGYKQIKGGNSAYGVRFSMNTNLANVLIELSGMYRWTHALTSKNRTRIELGADVGLFAGGGIGGGLYTRFSPGFVFPVRDKAQIQFKPFTLGIDGLANFTTTSQFFALSYTRGF